MMNGQPGCREIDEWAWRRDAGEKRTLGEAWGFNPKDERESKFLAG
jgi:hypothetical protein